MGHTRTFPGDNDHKRVARALIYARVCYLWGATEPPAGKFVTLVGEGDEINLFRYFLKIEPKEAVFIDKRKKSVGLDKASSQWKRASIVRANVLAYLRHTTDEIAFINLDFTGHFRLGETDKIFEHVGKRLSPGGAVSFTFPRGHEIEKQNKHWRFLKAHAIKDVKETGKALTTNPSQLRDEIRFRGYTHWIRMLLGKNAVPVLKLKYTRTLGKSMGVLVFQNVPPQLRTTSWLKNFRTHNHEEEKTGRIKSDGIQDRIRELVFWASRLGLSSKEVGGLLNLPAKTVGAYKANASRKKKPSKPRRNPINIVERVDTYNVRASNGVTVPPS